MERDPDTGLLEMKQTGLIDRIVEALGLNVGLVNGKTTPAEHAPLTKDEDGPPVEVSITLACLECCCICLGTLVLTSRTQSIVQLATCSVLDALMRGR